MNESLLLGFDVVLLLLLTCLAWLACNGRDTKRGITFFVAFGLLLAVIWARLKAPDLALAEAAIGAGISGALLLGALRDHPSNQQPETTPPMSRLSINLLSIGFFAVLAWALWHGLSASDGVRLAEAALAATPASGVSNPVTAVLLNLRAYDTLLELAVVLTAVIGVLALGSKRPSFMPAETMLLSMTRWLTPVLVLTSGYLLWVGAYAPGGAFQAGAVLAAAFILLQLSGEEVDRLFSQAALRWLLVIGVALFSLTGMALMLWNESFLTFPKSMAGMLILLIETAATLAIAAALTIAFIGGRPTGWDAGLADNKPGRSDLI